MPGIHFLVPVGTTGESPTLTLAERVRIVEILVDEAAAACRSWPAPADTTQRSDSGRGRDEGGGADGLLSVTPYYNKPTQEGLYQHYRAIAESTRCRSFVYNVPGRTGLQHRAVDASCDSQRLPNIVGIKEASGNMAQMCEVCRSVPPEFIVLSGDDAHDAAADGGGRPRRHFRRVE